MKKSIEVRSQPPKKATPTPPPPPSLASENESASAKRASDEKETGQRKKAKKSPTPPPPRKLTKPEKEYDGDRIAKLFDEDVYFGTVGEYWYDSEETKVYLWRIKYDDGDEEDVEKNEFLGMLELYEKNKADDPVNKYGY